MIAPDQALNTKRMEHLYSKLCKLSLLILDGVIKEFSDSDFRPAFFELRIDGRDSNPAPIELSLKNGARLVLRGFVDRVDVWKDNGEVYIRIVDYKTGSKQFSLSDLDYGINTQMLLYLFAICSSPSKKMEISDGKLPIPAGVVYLSSAISQTKLSGFEVSEQEILMQASENLSRSGILLSDERVLYAMSHSASKQILMGVTQKDGEFVGSSLVSGEEFSDIYDKIKQILVEIGDKIYDGIADCSPLELGGQDPCKYCTVKQMCRKSDF
jgi:ATP-dependent helicase/nuclease subunit B